MISIERIEQRMKELEIKSWRELSRKINISASYLGDIKNKRTQPSLHTLASIASALITSVSYLLGETDDPRITFVSTMRDTYRPEADSSPETTAHSIPTDPAGWRRLPLFSKLTAACGGAGNGLAYADSEIDSWHYFPAEIYGAYDPERPPYMHYVDGDSMEEAYIHDGSMIIVNPAEAIYDGESALVCWDNDEVAVKLIYWQKDGGVELHAANPDHTKVYMFTKEDIHEGRLIIKGKIMWSGRQPKRMR